MAEQQGRYRVKFLSLNTTTEPHGDFFCYRCGKTIQPGRHHRMVHIIDGGLSILHPQDESRYVSDAGDMGAHPLGLDCARKIGLEWSHRP